MRDAICSSVNFGCFQIALPIRSSKAYSVKLPSKFNNMEIRFAHDYSIYYHVKKAWGTIPAPSLDQYRLLVAIEQSTVDMTAAARIR